MKGLADLNDDVLDGYHDLRLRTLIAYVPTLGAEEEDVPAAAKVVTGGNVSHYWEDSGIIGSLFKESLGIDVYAWDVWMIYKPGVEWNRKLPPAPDYWMHNLWGVENQTRLDSKVFSEEVNKYLDSL